MAEDPWSLAATVAGELPDPVVWVDDQLRLRWLNRAASDTFGWQLDAQTAEMDMLQLIHPDDMAEAMLATQTVAGKSVGTLLELRIRAADGSWRRTEVRGRPDPAGRGGLLLVVRDLGDRHGWDLTGGDLDQLRTIIEASSTPVLVCETNGQIRSSSAALARVLGFDREQVRGRHLASLCALSDRAAVQAVFTDTTWRHRSVQVRLVDGDGEVRPFRMEMSNLGEDPAVRGVVCFAHDIAAVEAALASARRAADVDPLTGLLNRQAMMRELRARMSHPGTEVAVLFCDLDGFKAVNDLFGHGRGDELLCEVAQRLVAAVRSEDVVARLGGDEFIVISSARTPEELETLADRVERAVRGYHHGRPGEVAVSASVGAVIATAGSATAEEVLAEADALMYRAKAGRRGMRVHDEPLSERRALARELSDALSRGQVTAHFQPVVDISTGQVCGFETLARWDHPTRGLLLPEQFLPVCEEAGLEGRLADTVISAAIDLLARIGEPMGVSVNLSPLQLADPEISSTMLEALEVAGVSPDRLAVEVSEASVLARLSRDGRRVSEVLADLGASGVRIALDHFGTGEASLARLVEIPASILKVDRTLTARVAVDPVVGALVRSVTALAAELGVVVVAEGVESAAQAEVMKQLGCSFAQGWGFTPAVPLGDAVGLGCEAGTPRSEHDARM